MGAWVRVSGDWTVVPTRGGGGGGVRVLGDGTIVPTQGGGVRSAFFRIFSRFAHFLDIFWASLLV